VIVALARIELRLTYAHSLKEKRRALRSMLDRVRSRFSIAVSEVDGQDSWQRAVVGFAVVGSDEVTVSALRDRVAEFIIDAEVGELVKDERENVHFGDAALMGQGEPV
jgi:uncharacterized protein YlxP (DUF503 family)